MQTEILETNAVLRALTQIMRRTLDLGQISMTEHQFKSFRRLIMDEFANMSKELGRCGTYKTTTRKDVPYE
jgi:hypothetical protein